MPAARRKPNAATQARIADISTLIARVGRRNQLLVKITTEDGLIGWGESGLSGRELSVAATVEHYAGFLKGQDSRNIGRIWQESYRSQYFEGGRVLTAAISAIDIALYDLLGKRLGVPVYQLLGGKQRDVIPTFGTTMGTTKAQQLKDVALLVEQGWTCIRTYPGSFDEGEVFDPRATLSETAQELMAIRAEFGNKITLGVDMHHRYSVAEAADFCAMMPKGTLNFIEEPIRSETPEAYAALRKLTDVPFAVGEEFASKWEAARFLDAGMTQYMRLDVSNIGGFTEAMKVAGMSERHYVDVMPHNPLGPICTAASVHMSAAIPNFSWLETRQTAVEKLGYHDASLFPKQIEMQGPVYLLPDEPGLGIEVNEDALREQKPELVEAPHLKRPDGSVTNW
ncbi:MAG: mandelate racemase/muconate lactonizing enzyme family protein [Cognatishimia sp.]